MISLNEPAIPLMAKTDPQRGSIFTKGPSDVLDQATSEIGDEENPGEGFNAESHRYFK